MRNILEELYFGEIRPCEKAGDKEQSELLTQLIQLEAELMLTLTSAQKAQLREYLSVAEKMHCAAEAECFGDGFKLGIRLILASAAE